MILNRKAVSAVYNIDTTNVKVKRFRYNSEAARFFYISEWWIRSYKKSEKLYLNRHKKAWEAQLAERSSEDA